MLSSKATTLAESGYFLQKTVIKTKYIPLNQTLVQFKRAFLYRLFPLFTGTFFIALSLIIAFSASFWCAPKASAPYWNPSSATLASSAGFTTSMLPMCLFHVLPYPSGTVLHLWQAVRFFLWRHPHSLRYQTAAFSLPRLVLVHFMNFHCRNRSTSSIYII